MDERRLDLPIRELAARLRDGSVRAEALAEVALGRAEESLLGSYRVIRKKSARREAQLADAMWALGRDPGPLAGIPMSVKDLYGLPGERIYAGTKKELPARFEAFGPLLARASRQGAVFSGKTHTVEFAFGGIGSNPHWGAPRNPYCDEHRAPGGSSSGAGTSLFEGSAKVAFGTDTAGSVRIPAAWTGNVGLKTTKGRWPTEGIVPLSTTLDTPGILTRSVEDLQWAFAALDGSVETFRDRWESVMKPPPLVGIRAGLASGVFFEDCSPGVAEAVEAAVLRLEKSGIRIVRDFKLSGVDEAQAIFGAGGPTAIELHRFLADELPDWLEHLDPIVADRLRAAGETPASEYLRRLHGMKTAHRAAMGALDSVDVVLSPTVANSPPRLADLADLNAYRRENLLALRNTGLVSVLGLCAISLPCGLDKLGLPVGLQLVGPAFSESKLLALAGSFEEQLSADVDDRAGARQSPTP